MPASHDTRSQTERHNGPSERDGFSATVPFSHHLRPRRHILRRLRQYLWDRGGATIIIRNVPSSQNLPLCGSWLEHLTTIWVIGKKRCSIGITEKLLCQCRVWQKCIVSKAFSLSFDVNTDSIFISQALYCLLKKRALIQPAHVSFCEWPTTFGQFARREQ
jgi:hypothetical protein